MWNLLTAGFITTNPLKVRTTARTGRPRAPQTRAAAPAARAGAPRAPCQRPGCTAPAWRRLLRDRRRRAACAPPQVLVEVLGLLLLSRLVEPIYGSKEFLKFLVIVELLASTATFVAVYLAYAATMSPAML